MSENTATATDSASELTAVMTGLPIGTQDYKVELEIFEGPLDLLLYLIKKEELDIHDIPISRVTRQYLEYLEIMKLLDLNIAGEFLLMAATLMLIKSKTLLPPEERAEEEEEEIDDPRIDLVRQLLEYKKFKEVAQDLKDMQDEIGKTFSRIEDELPLTGKSEKRLVDVGIFDLLSAFSSVLKRIQLPAPQEIEQEEISVGDRIVLILQALSATGQARFSSFFDNMSSRMEIAVTFLAMLELIRQKKIGARQRQTFGDIEIILKETN